jgi:uncharacterized membrane protein YedE/YeeE
MESIFPDRIPWFIAGPILGLCVVALYALANRPLGTTSAYTQTVAAFFGRSTEVWRVWFFVGLVAGALVAAFLSGGPVLNFEYGALGRTLPLMLLIPVLLVAGILIGYGARWAGGCTAGHGLNGCSTLSPASFAATASFMASAILVTVVLHLVTGGAI